MISKFLASVFLAFALSGCATVSDPTVAVAADAATTAAALSSVPGAVELNPLGWLSVPIRLAVIEHAKHEPIAQGLPIIHAVSAASWGAAANNLLVLGGAVGAAPLAVGVLVAVLAWEHGANQREFWAMCAQLRRANSNLACEYTPT